MNEMNITLAQYVSTTHNGQTFNDTIKATIDGVEVSVPLTAGNRHYDEIMRQVEAGDLTILDAD